MGSSRVSSPLRINGTVTQTPAAKSAGIVISIWQRRGGHFDQAPTRIWPIDGILENYELPKRDDLEIPHIINEDRITPAKPIDRIPSFKSYGGASVVFSAGSWTL